MMGCMNKAIVTLVVGDRCQQPWLQYLRPGWERWAERHGYDLIVFDQPLDHSRRAASRSPAWQKLLAMASPLLKPYDWALWLDADVFIAPDAPDPFIHADPSSVCMARDVGSPLSHEPLWFRRQWSTVLRQSLLHADPHYSSILEQIDCELFSYYDLWGFNARDRPLYNSGVIGFSPGRCSDLFCHIYGRWHDGGPSALYEMIPLNLELAQRHLLAELDVRYNQLAGVHHAVWRCLPQQVQALHHLQDDPVSVYEFMETLLRSNYFVHFAGAHGLMVDVLGSRHV